MKANFEPVPVPVLKEKLVSVELTPREAVAVWHLIGTTSNTIRKDMGLSENDNNILSWGKIGNGLYYDLEDALKRGGLK